MRGLVTGGSRVSFSVVVEASVGGCTVGAVRCGGSGAWKFDSVAAEMTSGNTGSAGSGRSCCWLCCSRLLTVRLLGPSPVGQLSEGCSEGTADHGVLTLRSHGEGC